VLPYSTGDRVTKKRGLRIAVCVPSHDNAPALFAFDLANMMGCVGATLVADGVVEQVGLMYVQGTYVHSARQQLANAVKAAGVDFALWLDADMRFPKTLLHDLLRHNKPMVGINYSTRGVPPRFVAISKVKWTPETEGAACQTLDSSTGLEEVEGIGFGAVLIRADVFRALPDPTEKPWFWFEWLPHGEQVGEDIYFCRLVREAGFPILVDHDLSKQCAHIGQFEYKPDHVVALQEERAQG
jgi:hypothetical protein